MMSTTMQPRLFYRVDEVATLLGISVRTVYRKVAEKEIPSVPIRGIVRIPVQQFHERFGIAPPKSL